jgi:tol-pal system protein YbgF
MKTLLVLTVIIILAGCASSDETTQLRFYTTSVHSELTSYKSETDRKLANLSRDNESLRQQLVGLSTTVEASDDKMKGVLGKLDEMDHRMKKLQSDVTTGPKTARKTQPDGLPLTAATPAITRSDYEAKYKEAFEAFQKGRYEDSARLFTDFLSSTPETPLRPNAYYWVGESYLNLKDYEKAVLAFQEVIDKYPDADRAPGALLAQAEAFNAMKDRKSTVTVLKKLVEKYPESGEAAVAERKLKSIEFTPEPRQKQPREESGDSEKKMGTVVADTISLRVSPSLRANPVTKISKGTSFDITAEQTDLYKKKWYKVRTKTNREGWVQAESIKIRESGED